MRKWYIYFIFNKGCDEDGKGQRVFRESAAGASR